MTTRRRQRRRQRRPSLDSRPAIGPRLSRRALLPSRLAALAVLAVLLVPLPSGAQYDPRFEHERDATSRPVATPAAVGGSDSPASVEALLRGAPSEWTSPSGLSSSLQMVIMLTVLSLAPAVLLMTTSFVRIAVVLGMLRQALGTQQLPPNQVVMALSMFMTLLIMAPVWSDVHRQAIVPYTQSDGEMSLEEAWEAGIRPVRRFMSRQIDLCDNEDDVLLFYEYLPEGTEPPETFDDVPLRVLLPAFMLSELKVAFLIGFQIYLPFLILDIVVSSVTISMGMLMLPPAMISLPLKILLFVLVDGWTLIVTMLLRSFVPYT